MTKLRATALSLSIAAFTLLSACNRPAADTDATEATASDSGGFISKAIDQEIVKARTKLHEGNLVISGDHRVDVAMGDWKFKTGSDSGDAPRAEISPQGDLLVDGKAVAVTPAQRELLLQYREQVLGVADAGLAIGSKGADLASEAIGEAIGSIFGGGDTDAMEKRVEARAEQLKQDAMAICTQLPGMLATQQQLAASLPAFKPYATMTRREVEDCADDINDKGAWSTE